jgi:EamA domain-containing membrane protein RarD
MATTLLRRPLWWAGTAAAVAGYDFQALALIKGSLILGQPVGVLFGVVAVVTKINMHILEQRGVPSLLATPAPYVLVVLGVIATLLQQSAFHVGALHTAVPTMLVLEPVVAVILGALLLGEEFETSGYEAIALAIAVVAMTAATVGSAVTRAPTRPISRSSPHAARHEATPRSEGSVQRFEVK